MFYLMFSLCIVFVLFFFFKQKTAYEMRISDWSSDVCSSDLDNVGGEILDAALGRLRMHARVVLCGGISQYNATGKVRGPANYLALISARARMQGFVVLDYLDRADEALAVMAPWAAAGKLGSRIDVIEGLENFAEALRRVYLGANFGKIGRAN